MLSGHASGQASIVFGEVAPRVGMRAPINATAYAVRIQVYCTVSRKKGILKLWLGLRFLTPAALTFPSERRKRLAAGIPEPHRKVCRKCLCAYSLAYSAIDSATRTCVTRFIGFSVNKVTLQTQHRLRAVFPTTLCRLNSGSKLLEGDCCYPVCQHGSRGRRSRARCISSGLPFRKLAAIFVNLHLGSVCHFQLGTWHLAATGTLHLDTVNDFRS